MLYALTINPGHTLFNVDINEVVNRIIIEYRTLYVNIVSHDGDHYHALIDYPDIIEKSKSNGALCHYEIVRNVKAYIKYMYSHDVVASCEIGELPYYEDDNIIDYLIQYGPHKTVSKYGWLALKQYNNLRKFYEDIKKGGSDNEINS